ncbi:hypothetical protein [Gloeobacter kilaueensis]|uniref:Uncharacterized protein n=1 Tax=Gloeobacter kilaueensis (strain ATCC BAA-2537 / CCAP 1431/1 / ULC 316 / JS1) TaxID=1183438 RepID=U5QLX0_GLOK1|nr:hypothetical protein [Gloeobacter kilaueensis]AGY58614.1 hypothetical protein GKIL_2368 [Gloeobacter kilaueensis JS1]
MKSVEERSFDIEELKQYFFADRQPVEEFDLEAMRRHFDALLQRGAAR